MALNFQVETLLTADQLADLRAFRAERLRKVTEVHEWLLAHGFTLARSSVGNWMAKEDGEAEQAKQIAASGMAGAIKSVLAGEEFETFSEATGRVLQRKTFEFALALQDDDELSHAEKAELLVLATRAQKNLRGTEAVRVKMLAEKFNREVAAKQNKAAELRGGRRELTQQDLDEVAKAVFG